MRRAGLLLFSQELSASEIGSRHEAFLQRLVVIYLLCVSPAAVET